MPEQYARPPRIFRSDELDLLQDFECAQRDVVEVADWRRDNEKHSLRLTSTERPTIDQDFVLRVARHPAILSYDGEMALLCP
jgi:hypothetical protein